MKLLRMKQLLEIIPVSKSTLYKWVQDKKFPEPSKKYSSRCVVWCEDDVKKWMEQ